MKQTVEVKKELSEQPALSHGGAAQGVKWSLLLNGVPLMIEHERYAWGHKGDMPVPPPIEALRASLIVGLSAAVDYSQAQLANECITHHEPGEFGEGARMVSEQIKQGARISNHRFSVDAPSRNRTPERVQELLDANARYVERARKAETALQALIVFTKPSKSNAVALNNAYRVLGIEPTA